MPFAPAVYARPAPVTITPFSLEAIGYELRLETTNNITAAAWPAANVVIFVPFQVPEACVATKMFWFNGVVAGNVDVGIYAEDQTRLVSIGTTAVSGANVVQIVDIADTALARGRYYMAMVADTVTTLTINSIPPVAGLCQAMGMLEQASVTLPLSTNANPATFAKYTRAYVPMFGVQLNRTSGP